MRDAQGLQFVKLHNFKPVYNVLRTKTQSDTPVETELTLAKESGVSLDGILSSFLPSFNCLVGLRNRQLARYARSCVWLPSMCVRPISSCLLAGVQSRAATLGWLWSVGDLSSPLFILSGQRLKKYGKKMCVRVCKKHCVRLQATPHRCYRGSLFACCLVLGLSKVLLA